MPKTAFITGITGQDGSCLAELLLEKGYHVHGLVRRASTFTTGKTQTVQEFADLVFAQLKLDPQKYIEIDPRYFRPAEVDLLLGDCSKAHEELGWAATTSLAELAKLMVDHDLELARQEAMLAAN